MLRSYGNMPDLSARRVLPLPFGMEAKQSPFGIFCFAGRYISKRIGPFVRRLPTGRDIMIT